MVEEGHLETSNSLSEIFMDLALTASLPLFNVSLNSLANSVKISYLMSVDTGKAERYYKEMVRYSYCYSGTFELSPS
jgi:hypothetical protein